MANIFDKYIVQKSDGSPINPNAQYFVLRIDTDPAARKAALRYSSYISQTDPDFADEIFQWVMQFENQDKRLSPLIWCDYCQTEHIPDCPCTRNKV